MDFKLPEEIEMIQATVRGFVDKGQGRDGKPHNIWIPADETANEKLATFAEVIAASNLTTFVIAGGDTLRLTESLRGQPGVEQVAPFGTELHVVGADGEALRRSVDAAVAAAGGGAAARPGDTSLEDVFIRLMQQAQVQDRSNGAAS